MRQLATTLGVVVGRRLTYDKLTSGHRDKVACEAEIRAFMAEHPDAEVLDLTAKAATG